MKETYLLPVIKAIENDTSLSKVKKDILCFLAASTQFDPEGVQLSELHNNVKLSRDRMYKVLIELEENELIARIKKGRCMYIKPNIDTISALVDKNENKNQVVREVLKLRLFCK